MCVSFLFLSWGGGCGCGREGKGREGLLSDFGYCALLRHALAGTEKKNIYIYIYITYNPVEIL